MCRATGRTRGAAPPAPSGYPREMASSLPPLPLTNVPAANLALAAVLTCGTAVGTGGLFAVLTDLLLHVPLDHKPEWWALWCVIWAVPSGQVGVSAVHARALLPAIARGWSKPVVLVATWTGCLGTCALLGMLAVVPLLLWMASLGALAVLPALPVVSWLWWRAARVL